MPCSCPTHCQLEAEIGILCVRAFVTAFRSESDSKSPREASGRVTHTSPISREYKQNAKEHGSMLL